PHLVVRLLRGAHGIADIGESLARSTAPLVGDVRRRHERPYGHLPSELSCLDRGVNRPRGDRLLEEPAVVRGPNCRTSAVDPEHVLLARERLAVEAVQDHAEPTGPDPDPVAMPQPRGR